MGSQELGAPIQTQLFCSKRVSLFARCYYLTGVLFSCLDGPVGHNAILIVPQHDDNKEEEEHGLRCLVHLITITSSCTATPCVS